MLVTKEFVFPLKNYECQWNLKLFGPDHSYFVFNRRKSIVLLTKLIKPKVKIKPQDIKINADSQYI